MCDMSRSWTFLVWEITLTCLSTPDLLGIVIVFISMFNGVSGVTASGTVFVAKGIDSISECILFE